MNILKVTGLILSVIFILLILSLVELWTQLSRYQNYWSDNNSNSSGEMTYVALGDSAAQGVGASRPEKGYVGIISKELSKNRSVKTVNLSKSGAKIGDVLSTQLPALEKLDLNSSSIVTIEIGANDIPNFNPLEFEIQMDELMEKLPEQAVLSDIPYFGGSRLRSMQPNVEKANEIMYKMADKHGRQLVPLHDKIKHNDSLRNYAIDYFHPSNYSYRKNWAPVFLDKINSNLISDSYNN